MELEVLIMSLTIELSPFERAQLDAAAEREGLPAEVLARKLLARQLIPENGHAGGEDPTLALFRKWKEEGTSRTAEEAEEENALYEQFLTNVNETRASLGMRLL
jgi:hypothetical protein